MYQLQPRSWAIAVLAALGLLQAGCAPKAGRSGTLSRPPYLVGDPGERAPTTTPAGSLAEYAERIRGLSARAAAGRVTTQPLLIERTDAELRAALAALAGGPTPSKHRAVAAAYARLRVSDLAYEHYTAALALDPADGAAYDALARLWRDWGFPGVALADAHRAVYHLPRSAAARNTLGTVLHALGQLDEARNAYRMALRLDPAAAWALSNVCALELEAGRGPDAERACREAVALDPALLAARRNLAIALGAAARQPPGLAGAAPGRRAPSPR